MTMSCDGDNVAQISCDNVIKASKKSLQSHVGVIRITGEGDAHGNGDFSDRGISKRGDTCANVQVDSATALNTAHLDKEMSDAVLNVITQIVMQQQESSSYKNNLELEEDGLSSLSNSEENHIFKNSIYNCDKCSRKIKRKDNFKRHYWQVHHLKYQDISVTGNCKNVCIFPGCTEIFYHKSRMVKHLEEEHDVCVETENKSFYDFTQFLKWKEKEEGSNFVCFTKRDERKISDEIMYSSYVCQCDGMKSKNISKKSVVRRKSVKKDLICPARMLVRKNIESQEVTVKYIKSHNHRITYEDMKNHPIPKSVKDQITTKLLEKKTVDDVFSELHQEAHEENNSESNNMSVKKILIEKSKIRYMQQKLNLPKTQSCNKLLIEDRLKALSTEVFNPILLYKPEGVIIENENADEVQNDDTTFIFALQTKEQSNMFKTFAYNIVFLELTHPTPCIPYHILTIKVLDDLMQSYNVAHLITNVRDEDIAQIFFNEIKLRCPDTDFKIQAVMTTLDTYGVKSFQKVFGDNIPVLYSKWHLHKALFSKLLSDYPLEEELQQQVYFSIVALVEESDQDQFQSIVTEFIHSYKDRCPAFVSFLIDTYLSKSEEWALCYRNVTLRKCDDVMHLNTMFQQLKSMVKMLKDVCSVDELLHAILNIDQANYLEQRCKQSLSEVPCNPHDIGLAIPDLNVSKISDSQWIIILDQNSFEINWNSDGCLEEFCQIRCLNLVCFGLCQHMYMCSCRNQGYSICSHIHKVHALETGVCKFQNAFQDNECNDNATYTKEFTLHNQLSSLMGHRGKQELVETTKNSLNVIQKYLNDERIQGSLLNDINTSLESIIVKCKAVVNSALPKRTINNIEEECNRKKPCFYKS